MDGPISQQNLRVVSLKLLELTQFAWPNLSIYFNFLCAVPRDDVIEGTRFLMRPPVNHSTMLPSINVLTNMCCLAANAKLIFFRHFLSTFAAIAWQRGFVMIDRTYVFSMHRKADVDDRIYECLLTVMAAVQQWMCVPRSCLWVTCMAIIRNGWSSTITNRHGVVALDFATVSGSIICSLSNMWRKMKYYEIATVTTANPWPWANMLRHMSKCTNEWSNFSAVSGSWH